MLDEPEAAVLLGPGKDGPRSPGFKSAPAPPERYRSHAKGGSVQGLGATVVLKVVPRGGPRKNCTDFSNKYRAEQAELRLRE
jgi:hypothetical protein